jgi:hypothetical protein
MRLNFFVGIASHEYVRVGIQAVGPALGATALEVGDLLDADIEFRLPLVLWDIDIFAVEDLIDRVGTVGRVSARCASSVMMSHGESQCGEGTKSCESKKNSPPGSAVAQIVVIFGWVSARVAACRSGLCRRGSR